MSEITVNDQYTAICHLIKQKRLKEALAQLESFTWQCNNYELKTRLEQMQMSYHYMLQYMKQGVADPDRSKLHKKLLTQAYEIADQIKLSILDDISNDFYHKTRRRIQLETTPYSIAHTQMALEAFTDDMAISSLISPDKKKDIVGKNEEVLLQMFQHTFCNSEWNSSDETQAQQLLDSSIVQVNALALMVSAVTMSLMRNFDIKKVYWLIQAYRSTQTQVAQRALVGLAITLHLYPERTEFYPQLENRLSILNEETLFATELLVVYKQLLLAQETEKIDKKMREEIIPEMIKNANQINNFKLDIDETDDEKEGINPDWQNLFDETGLSDKLKEMSDLQLEGADVQMSTFSGLKGFPFFREMHHWFYPFDRMQKEVAMEMEKDMQENKFFNLILDSGIFCNSDKYSLFFIMQQFPQSQREMVFNQMTEQQMDEFMNDEKTKSFKNITEQPTFVSNQYIHDLYRFFKLFIQRHEFRNIFGEIIELHRVPLLKPYLYNEQAMATIVDFHLKKEHWVETAEMCEGIALLAQSLSTQSDLYEKLGFALQKTKQIDKAIEAYIKADTIKPDHLWTLRHLATCYRLKHDYQKALQYYKKIETITPDNHLMVYYMGSCLAELGKYDEALNYFFKLDFIENNSVKSWRGIAWCSFVADKLEQAMKHYQKIIDTKPKAMDYLNAGHVAWSMHRINEAAGFYQKAAQLFGSKDLFIDMFYKDQEFLMSKGVNADDISLMIDLVE